MPNLNEKQRKFLGWLVVAAAITLAGYLGFTHPLPEPPEDIIQLGTTHFGSLELEDDLTVTDDGTIGDDLTVAGDLTVTGNINQGSLYGVVGAAALEIYGSTATFTGTTSIGTATHGVSDVNSVTCAMGETPATGAGDGAMVWCAFGATGNITLTVEQDDFTTNAANSTVVNYIVIGTP